MINKINNIHQINEIILKKSSRNICTLGKEEYTNNFAIHMCPLSDLPDYRDVDMFFEKEIEGKTMTVEEAVFAVFIHFINTYRPSYIEVASHVTNADHLEVTVTKHHGTRP